MVEVFNPDYIDLGSDNDIIHDMEGYKRCYDAKLKWLSPEEVLKIFMQIDPQLKQIIDEHGLERAIGGLGNITQFVDSGGKLPALTIHLNRDGSYSDLIEGMHRTLYAMKHGIRRIPVWFIRVLYKKTWYSMAEYSCRT